MDILITNRYAGHDIRILVECRDRARNETVEWIDALIGKSSSLDVNKVVAVSSKGFTEGALSKASKNGIDALTLKQARETDWGNYPIKPGVMVLTDDIFRITDVLYKHNDSFIQMSELGLESEIEFEGEIIGTLIELITFYFQEKLGPENEKYKKGKMLEIFRTKADLEKDMHVEVECNWPRITVLSSSGERVEIESVKYVVTGTRQSKDIEQKHQVFNQMLVSTGKHLDSDDSTIHFMIVQEPETKKAHVAWRRTTGPQHNS